MMPRTFNSEDLDALITLIRGADPEAYTIRSVSLNPDEVKLPGVWIRFDGVTPRRLDGLDLEATVHLIVPNAGGFARILAKLAEVYNLVAPALAGIGVGQGTATRTGVILAANTTPMPALAIPVSLPTTNPGE